MANGAYGSRSCGGNRLDRDDTIIDDILLDTPNRKGSGHGLCSSSCSDMYHNHCRYNPYKRNDSGYLSNELNKGKLPTFHGEWKISKHVEAWLLGMNNFFELHDYTENLKAKITIFNLKGKENIWWEDVKRVRDIRTEELSWHEFKRLFQKKYLSERYYDRKAKQFYGLKMGSMIDDEYMTKFLELLRYVPYLKY